MKTKVTDIKTSTSWRAAVLFPGARCSWPARVCARLCRQAFCLLCPIFCLLLISNFPFQVLLIPRLFNQESPQVLTNCCCQSQRLRYSQSPRSLVNKNLWLQSPHRTLSDMFPAVYFRPLNAWNAEPSHQERLLFNLVLNKHYKKKRHSCLRLLVPPSLLLAIFLPPTQAFCCLVGLQLLVSCCLSTALISVSLYMILEK